MPSDGMRCSSSRIRNPAFSSVHCPDLELEMAQRRRALMAGEEAPERVMTTVIGSSAGFEQSHQPEEYAHAFYETSYYATEAEKEGWSAASGYKGLPGLLQNTQLAASTPTGDGGSPLARHPVIHISWQDAAA